MNGPWWPVTFLKFSLTKQYTHMHTQTHTRKHMELSVYIDFWLPITSFKTAPMFLRVEQTNDGSSHHLSVLVRLRT